MSGYPFLTPRGRSVVRWVLQCVIVMLITSVVIHAAEKHDVVTLLLIAGVWLVRLIHSCIEPGDLTWVE